MEKLKLKLNIINHFKDDAFELYIISLFDKLVNQKLIDKNTYQYCYDDSIYINNIYRIITIEMNYTKYKNEKKLLLSRCFYKYCNNSDILELINEKINI